MNKEEIYEVYVVMAAEVDRYGKEKKFGCYCVCDNVDTAQAVLDKDTQSRDIRPGGWISSHVLQTKELI